MKIDFNYLNEVAQKLHNDYNVNSFDEGTHVYSIKFEPETGKVDTHIQWPMFKALAEMTECGNVEVTTIAGSPDSLHLECHIKGVRLTAVLFRHELVKMLEELHVEEDLTCMSAFELFIKWQSITGWKK